MVDDGDAGNGACIVNTHHHGDGVVETGGGDFHGVAVFTLVNLGDQVHGGEFHHVAAAGKNGADRFLGLFVSKLFNDGGGDGVDTRQSCCHDTGDDQQGHSQAQDIQSNVFLFHFFAASFLGAPNFTGRPTLSSRTTQQFITRMA